MSSLRNVAYNTAVLYVGKLVGILLSSVTIAILTRYLGVDAYGSFNTVLGYTAVITSITDIGLSWIISRELPKNNYSVLSPLLSFKILGTVVVMAIASIILPFIGYSSEVQTGIYIISFFTFFTSLNNFQIGVLQGMFAINKTAYSDGLGRLVQLILAFCIARYDLGLMAMLMALNVVGLVTFFANNYYIRQYALPGYKFTLKGMRQFSYDMMTLPLITALTYLSYKTDILILAKLAPQTDVGIYSAAYRILDVAVTVPSIFVTAFFPVISKAYGAVDMQERDKTLKFGFTVIALLAAITSVSAIVLSPTIIGIIGGAKYLTLATVSWNGYAITSVRVLQILSIFLLFSFFGSLFGSLAIAAKQQKIMVIAALGAVIFNIVSNILLIPHFSYLASAVITALTEIVLIIPLFSFLLYKRMVVIDWGGLFRITAAIGIASYCAYVLSAYTGPLLQFAALLTVYCALIALFGGEPRRLLLWFYVQVKGRITAH